MSVLEIPTIKLNLERVLKRYQHSESQRELFYMIVLCIFYVKEIELFYIKWEHLPIMTHHWDQTRCQPKIEFNIKAQRMAPIIIVLISVRCN